MNRSKVFILIAALCLCAALTAFALSDGALTELWESGCDFLFRTDNVTVTGKAAFSLDGERFKTAELNYVQDGYSSYYGLKLLTPKADGSEEETGWIIISDEDGICSVMEAYTPGVYRWATTAPQNPPSAVSTTSPRSAGTAGTLRRFGRRQSPERTSSPYRLEWGGMGRSVVAVAAGAWEAFRRRRRGRKRGRIP